MGARSRSSPTDDCACSDARGCTGSRSGGRPAAARRRVASRRRHHLRARQRSGLLRRRGSDRRRRAVHDPRCQRRVVAPDPALLDRGRHVVFFVARDGATRQGIWIAPTDAPANRKRLIRRAVATRIASGDALIYSSDGALVAQRLDFEALALTGRPVLLGTPVGQGPQHQLVRDRHRRRADLMARRRRPLRELRWVDRAGTRNRSASARPWTPGTSASRRTRPASR